MFVVVVVVGSYQMFFFEISINGIYLPSSFQTFCPLIHHMQQLQNSWLSLEESVLTIAEEVIAQKMI